MFNWFENLGHQITRIDTALLSNEFAACYVVASNREYALIETGTHNTVQWILRYLEQHNIAFSQVKYVIPTHVHLDHAGGAGGLMQALPNATLLIHPRGARHMIHPEKLKAGAVAVYGEAEFAKHYGDVIPIEENRVMPMEDESTVTLGNRTFTFYDTPGHAKHHFCVHDSESQGIFTGDTFGIAYPTLSTKQGPFIFPTTTPVQFDPVALKKSIQRLVGLHPKVMYLTHYGPIKNPAQFEAELLEQIDDFVENALRINNAVSEGKKEEALKAFMADYLIDRALKKGCDKTPQQIQQALLMDIELNSQGLLVWLNQKAQ